MGVIHGSIKPVLPVTDGLWGWWDAARGVTLSGPNVSHWNDQSGNGNHFTQLFGADQPLYEATAGNGDLNDLPVISFDGGASKTWMEIAGTSFYEVGNQYKYTFFMVYTDLNNVASNWGMLLNSTFNRTPSGEYPTTNPEQALLLIVKGGTGTMRWFGSCRDGFVGNMYGPSWGVTDANPHIIGQTFNSTFHPSTPTSWGASIDNGTEAYYPTYGQGNAYSGGVNPATSDYFYLNNGQNYVVPWGMEYKLAELILYNDALSNTDFNTMATYLNTKYAIY